MWNENFDINSGGPRLEVELLPPTPEKEFEYVGPKPGGNSSDGYLARDSTGRLYLIKVGAGPPAARSQHAFNEVITGTIYTHLHNRGLNAAPHHRLIIRQRNPDDGKPILHPSFPTGLKAGMGGMVVDEEYLVGSLYNEGLDPRPGQIPERFRKSRANATELRRQSSSLAEPDAKVKSLSRYFKTDNPAGGEALEDLMEAYFLDCLIGSWDTIDGNVFYVLPDTLRDTESNLRPLKLFKLDFGNGLEFFAGGGKKTATRGIGPPAAIAGPTGREKRGFWPIFPESSPYGVAHIVDEFPGPGNHPGTMRIALGESCAPFPVDPKKIKRFSRMRAVCLYALVSDNNIINFWRTRLGSGRIIERYKTKIQRIIRHYYKGTTAGTINSREKGEFLQNVLYYRIDQIYDVLPRYLETLAPGARYTTTSGVITMSGAMGGSKTRRGKKNKKNTLKKRNSRKYKSKLVKNKTKRK